MLAGIKCWPGIDAVMINFAGRSRYPHFGPFFTFWKFFDFFSSVFSAMHRAVAMAKSIGPSNACGTVRIAKLPTDVKKERGR